MSRLRNERGFSLVELVLVIVVIGILMVVVSPDGSALPEMKLRTATERVVSDLRYAQTCARQEGGPVGLSFDPAGGKYTVVHTAARTPARDPLEPTKNFVFDPGSDGRFAGLTFAWSLPGGNNALIFDSLGQPRDALYVVATTPASITLHLAAMTADISVEAITGRISSVVTP